MEISCIFNRLEEQCNSSIKCIKFVDRPEFLKDDITRNVREMVVNQAFVRVFTEWEYFLENSTIVYTLGESTLKGRKPVCYISPRDEEHAHQIIKGTSKYPDWSNMDVVIELEETLFEDGFLYKKALQGFSSKYKDMKKVRNHIAHNLVKSQNDFKSLVRTALNPSKVGISPADFLLSKKNDGSFFYMVYITCIDNAAKIIAESA